MKRQIFVFAFFAAALAALSLAACGGILEAPAAADGGVSGGKGRIIVSIAGGLSPAEAARNAAPAPRTLLPEYGPLTYTVEITKDGETDPAVSANIIATTLTRELDPGSYTLSVTAYKAGTDVPVAEGGVPLEVSAGQVTDVTVTLALYQAGAGYLDYTVGLPDGMTLKTGFLTLYPFSGNAAAMNVDLSGGLSGVEEVPSGYYRIRLLICGVIGGVSKTAAKTAVLHIGDSFTTTASYAFGPDDFTDAELHIVENSTGLGNALNSISAAPGSVFTILIRGNFFSPPVSLTNTGYDGKTITLHGDSVVNEISLAGQGSLFTIGSAASEPVLILQNITLTGVTGNNAALVKADNGTLIMEGGSVITGNQNSSYGGGVYVAESGSLILRDNASVSGNTASSCGGGVYIAENGSLTMQGTTSVSGNTALSYSYSYAYGGGVYVGNGGTFTLRDDASISGNTADSYGGGVYVDAGGVFTKQPGGIVYGMDAENTLENTVGSGSNADCGPAVFVNSSPAKIRYNTAGAGVTLDSAVSGAAGGWELLLPPISNITYGSVSGGDWTLEGDGRRRSPAIGDNTVTKARVSFISNTADTSITIQLDVSSESGYDFAFISTLDNDSAAYDNGYYTDGRISGGQSVTVTIPVPTAGSHFVDIGYRKDSSVSNGSDCAWFMVIQ
ncbi:MAG: hypothetical protein LBF77_04840 [Spirochaetaceae bacterium]|nr:hypothetical protein [Spirochaetaceae bacterium]